MKKIKVGIVVILLLSLILSATACFKKEKISDPILWINTTHIVLTEANQLDYQLVGGIKKNDANAKEFQDILKEWWDIKDKASADEMLKWLENEGHREQFANLIAEFELDKEEERDALLEVNPEEEDYINFVFETYQKSGGKAILAWDLSRANSVISQAYISGYYTYEEALDKSLEVAKMIQSNFESWEDMFDNYLDGYKFWRLLLDDKGEIEKINEEASVIERENIIAKLKTQPKGPFELDWNTKLEKTW